MLKTFTLKNIPFCSPILLKTALVGLFGLLSFASYSFHFHLNEEASASQTQKKKKKIRVAVMIDPPYVMRTPNRENAYEGFCIDIWNKIAEDLGYDRADVELTEFDSPIQVVLSIMRKQTDIVINPLPVSSIRLKQFDVTQPFFASSIGLAALSSNDNLWQVYFANLASWEFIKLFSILVGIVFVVGFFVWFIEKKYNPTDFRDGIMGILDGIWWSTVTITTVGYGDKTPKTILGRVISILWMFCAISLISSFTATITSTLTVNRLEYEVSKLEELRTGKKVGTVMHSTTKDYLEEKGLKLYEYTTPLEGLKALLNKEIDVFAYDRAALRYLIIEERLSEDIRLMQATFNRQFFSMLLYKNSPLFNDVNAEITDLLSEDEWVQLLKYYHLIEFE